MPGSTSPTRSICSAACGAMSRRRAAMSQRREADADAVRVAVVADTTRAYADAASARRAARGRQAHRRRCSTSRSTLTASGAEAGPATKLDTARIAALRDQRAADVPAIEAERQAALFRLATLTGRTPADLPADRGAADASTLRARPADPGRRRRGAARAPPRRARRRAPARRRRPRGSASRPPISIRASRWADRSARPAPASAICSAAGRCAGCSAR